MHVLFKRTRDLGSGERTRHRRGLPNRLGFGEDERESSGRRERVIAQSWSSADRVQGTPYRTRAGLPMHAPESPLARRSPLLLTVTITYGVPGISSLE
jgi:hypothetical protein